MGICKLVVNDGKKLYVICHRVSYKLFGENEKRHMDMATNLTKDLIEEPVVIPEEVVKTAEEAIAIMHKEYFEEQIPYVKVPFVIHDYIRISDKGEIL